MSKFTRFILFNIFVYFIYIVIDKILTSLDWYSDPKLGVDILVMPTSSDIWLIGINTLLSSAGAFYLLFKIKDKF
jgi:hypothetical protein